MNDLPTRIMETLVDLYEHQTGEKFNLREIIPEESEEHKEKSA